MPRVKIPPPPTLTEDKTIWTTWYVNVVNAINKLGVFRWIDIDFTGSALTDIVTRTHNSLQSIQGGTTNEYYHLTSAEDTALSNGQTVVITIAKLTPAGANGSLTFTNGILTAYSAAT